MRKYISKLSVFLVLTSLLLSGCSNQNKSKEPELLKPPKVSDKTEKVTYRDICNMQNFETTVVPYYQEIVFDKEGVFGEFYVKIGDKVKKGQKLASKNVQPYKEELNQLKKTYEETKSKYENDKKLNELDLKITQAKLKKEESALKSATADAKEATQYTIETLKLKQKRIQKTSTVKYEEYKEMLASYDSKMVNLKKQISTNTVVAPFDGVVTCIAHDIEPGDMVKAYFPIVSIADTTKLYVSYDSYFEYSMFKKERFYAIFHGKECDLEYNSDSSLSQKNTEDKPKIGDTGLLCMQFNYKEHVLSITNKALYSEGENQDYVYRIKDGKKEKVPVTVGAITDIYTEIVGGLEEGDVICHD